MEVPVEESGGDLGRLAEQRDLRAGLPPARSGEPVFHRFESFEDRGASGDRSYKWDLLEVEMLEGRAVRYERDARGHVTRAIFDDGRVHRVKRLAPELVALKRFGVPDAEGKCAARDENFCLNVKGRPGIYTAGDAAWVFEWKDGLLSLEQSPRGDRSYTYDSLHRLRSWRDSSKKGVELEREGAETRHLLADGQRFVLVEDSEGALREARQGEEVYTFTHEEGRLAGAKSPLATLSYASEGARRSVETPWGTSLTQYERSSGSERARWTETPAGTFRFTYSEGKRSQLRYPNGIVARYRYREGRDLVRLQSSVLDLQREFDERGLIVKERRDGSETPSVYGYDGFGQLTEVSEGGAQATYHRYTASGARANTFQDPNDRILDAWNMNLLLRCRARLTRPDEDTKWKIERLRTYRCDAAGRLVAIEFEGSERVDRFAYDGAGRLQEAQRAGGAKVRYAYDPLGRISSRSVGEGAEARVTRYVYDGPRLLAELGPGEATRVYAHGPDLDEPLAYRDGEGPWVYLHGDERGSVLAYSDAEGRRIDSVTYSAFGVLTQAPQGERPLFFAGHRYDPETRLVLARARAYEPELNRFMGPDPAGLRDGANPFRYAQNNPLSFVDPLGLFAVPSTTRSHYGTLSPRAQLLLLQRVNALRFSPSPAAPVLSLFKGMFPDLEVGGTRGEVRSGDAATDFLERLAAAETQEEAEELLGSPLAQAARKELGEDPYRIAEGVAEVVDDDERSNDSALLRELFAPTATERSAGVRPARSSALRMQFREKYLGIEANAELLSAMRTAAELGGTVGGRSEQGVRATDVPHMNGAELDELQEGLKRMRNSAWVSERTPVAEDAPWKPISRRKFARRAERSARYHSAGEERRAYRDALREQRKVWERHGQNLESLGDLEFGLRIERREGLDDLLELYRAEDRAVARRVREAEGRFRQALVRPLGYAEAYRRIVRDVTWFNGDKTQQLLRESMPVGEVEALQGPLEGFTKFGHLGGAGRPDYAERRAALRKQLAEREARESRIAEAARRTEKKRAARKAAKRPRGGVTLSGKQVASREARKPSATGGRARRRERAGRARRVRRGGVTGALRRR